MSGFESHGLKGGIWQGILTRDDTPDRLLLVHLGNYIAEARIAPETEGCWRVSVAIPADRLSNGVQTFLLYEDQGGKDSQPVPGAQPLGSLSIIAGEVLDNDLLVELNLLRSELDLVKKELRRLASG